MNELLQRYLDRAAKFNKNLHVATIQMPREPTVTPFEKIIDVPSTVWDNPQYGDIEQLIEYLRTANRIPDSATIEVAFEGNSREFRMRFNWWEVVILTGRHGPQYA